DADPVVGVVLAVRRGNDFGDISDRDRVVRERLTPVVILKHFGDRHPDALLSSRHLPVLPHAARAPVRVISISSSAPYLSQRTTSTPFPRVTTPARWPWNHAAPES